MIALLVALAGVIAVLVLLGVGLVRLSETAGRKEARPADTVVQVHGGRGGLAEGQSIARSKTMDDEWDYDRDEIVDLGGGWADVTGNPAEDVTGYQTPTRRIRPLTGYVPSSPGRDWLAQSKLDRQQREAKREALLRREPAGPRPVRAQTVSPEEQGWSEPSRPVPPPTGQPTGLLSGQHGAYFERRVKRCWWAPWKKRQTWQQISAWQASQPPRGVEVVTVADVTQLPGKVHTIDRGDLSGALEY